MFVDLRQTLGFFMKGIVALPSATMTAGSRPRAGVADGCATTDAYGMAGGSGAPNRHMKVPHKIPINLS